MPLHGVLVQPRPLIQIAHFIDRLFDAIDRDNPQTINGLLRCVGLRYQRHRKAQLGGFLEPLLPARAGSDLAGQTHFAEGNQALG